MANHFLLDLAASNIFLPSLRDFYQVSRKQPFVRKFSLSSIPKSYPCALSLSLLLQGNAWIMKMWLPWWLNYLHQNITTDFQQYNDLSVCIIYKQYYHIQPSNSWSRQILSMCHSDYHSRSIKNRLNTMPANSRTYCDSNIQVLQPNFLSSRFISTLSYSL